MNLIAKEIILYDNLPLTVYIEDAENGDKYIASWIKSEDMYDYYILYPVADRAEYNEDDDWQKFVNSHPAQQRVDHTQITWIESNSDT